MTSVSLGFLQRDRSYFWSSLQGPGMEQLRLRLDPEENVARGILMGVEEDRPFRLQYKLKWRSDWRVRRLDLIPGQSAEIRALYVEPPALTFKAVTQRYSCLERAPGRHRVTYEGYPSGFKAELTLDADGLVIDYPELFRRVAPR